MLLLACGGQTTTDSDASADVASEPIVECHGYCPQPNGSKCASDCDCYQKCLTGKDTPPQCADPLVQGIPCGDAASCPPNQKCGVFGYCEGATCATTNECPAQQTCMSGACVGVGCI